MKREVSPGVIGAVVLVVVLVIAAVAWKVFAPTHVSKADSDAFLATHPGIKAASENMKKMGENPTPPPGANKGGRPGP
jgi:hypothetical protein